MVVEGEEDLQALVTNCFSGLFTPMEGTNLAHVLPHLQPRVTDQMNEFLIKQFTREEVHQSLESIGDLKAPGADGMSAIFYKKMWGRWVMRCTRC